MGSMASNLGSMVENSGPTAGMCAPWSFWSPIASHCAREWFSNEGFIAEDDELAADVFAPWL
jgi:hypothetical protein